MRSCVEKKKLIALVTSLSLLFLLTCCNKPITNNSDYCGIESFSNATKTEESGEKEAKETLATIPEEYEAVIVNELPEGFVLMVELEEAYKDIQCIFFETQLAFVKRNTIKTVHQIDIKDDSFIIKYKDSYYINESLFNQFVLDKLNSTEK